MVSVEQVLPQDPGRVHWWDACRPGSRARSPPSRVLCLSLPLSFQNVPAHSQASVEGLAV